MNWFFQTRTGKIVTHALAWAGILLLPLVLRELVGPPPNIPRIISEPSSVKELTVIFGFQLVMIGFFYLNSWVLVPRWLWKREFGYYFATIIAALLVLILLFLAVQQSSWLQSEPFFRDRKPFGVVMVFILFWFASLGHCMTLAWFRSEKARRDLENEKLKTELSFLQGQVNPHFLFNTLNTIYTLAHRQSERTPGAVMQLSNLLRYVLDTPQDEVLLTEEIRHLEDLIALHQLRLTQKTHVSFEVKGDPNGLKIAPMLFLPFVENAFKHGVSAHRESNIQFVLTLSDKQIEFSSINANLKSSEHDTRTTGIGIPNVRRRLELIYPEKHRLEIEETGERYFVRLLIFDGAG